MITRHFTASAVGFDDLDQVLLVHHKKLGLWLYPGGHVDPNEDPAQAAVREVIEETGVEVVVLGEPAFTHPAVHSHVPPWVVIEMEIRDSSIGPHRHIDFVYVCQPSGGSLAPQGAEVSRVLWVPLAELTGLHTPDELPELVAAAARWVETRRRRQSEGKSKTTGSQVR
jgi:8-oxo-dGTP diphosphatase